MFHQMLKKNISKICCNNYYIVLIIQYNQLKQNNIEPIERKKMLRATVLEEAKQL